jgi:hypothetical protein
LEILKKFTEGNSEYSISILGCSCGCGIDYIGKKKPEYRDNAISKNNTMQNYR